MVFDVEMGAHHHDLILPYPLEFHPAGAVRLDVHAVSLVGGVVADKG